MIQQKQPLNTKPTQSLGVRLLKVVFSIYLLVTFVITSAQMYHEYKFEKERIQTNLDTYQLIYGEAVGTALWNLDDEQLVATLDGASALNDIAGILLYDNNQDTIYHSGLAPTTFDDKHLSQLSLENLFFSTFKIEYTSKHIGTLYLYSSDQIVFDKVKFNFLFILVNALIKSAVLWLVFLWAFKKYLVGALDRFTEQMKATDFDNLGGDQPDVSESYLSNSTELNKLDAVFTSLKERLRTSKDKLEDLNTNLEATVDRRTEMLRRQQRVMESMSRQAHIGAWEYDIETESTFWSAMTRDIFEVSADFEPSQRNTLSFFGPEQGQRLKELERLALEKGRPWEEELQITTAKGNTIWVASTGEAEIRDGRCIRLYGSFQDIDMRVRTAEELMRAKEEAEAADKLKTAFLTSMSHEIRTPMNGIIGMLSVLLGNNLNDSQREQAEVSLRSAENLMHLLDDLLDLSRIESGTFKLEKTDFDIKQLVEDQAVVWRNRAESKGLQLDLDASGLTVTKVHSDPHRVQQILANLLSNAIKFTDTGSVRLIIASSKVGSAHQIAIDILDEGVGIEPARQETIFKSFVQDDFKTTRTKDGAGIGLAIVNEIVKQMNGSIKVNSQLNKGSTFSVTLTVDAPTPSKKEDDAIKNIDALPESASSPDIRILVVEDNPVNQMVARAMLEQLGMSCDITENGQEALEQMVNNQDSIRYAMILMDCMMPVMDGYEATQRIREGDAGDAYRPIPIIAMTANAMKGDREKCINIGMDDYLAKPVTPESLKEMVSRWFDR